MGAGVNAADDLVILLKARAGEASMKVLRTQNEARRMYEEGYSGIDIAKSCG